MSRPTCIYFVQPVDGGLVKIGRADNPEKRLRDMQVGSPLKLRLCSYHQADTDMELRLHLLFSKYREHGEWFKPCPALAAIAGAIPDETLTDDDITPNPPMTADTAWNFNRELIRDEWGLKGRDTTGWTEADFGFHKIQYDPITAIPPDADPDWQRRGQRLVG
jgi:hypothetical protein